MKVYLDDVRVTPPGWVRTYTVEQTISILKTGNVTYLSLDHDLGICIDCGGDIPIILEDGKYIPFYASAGDDIESIDTIPPPPALDLDLESPSLNPAALESDKIITIPAPPPIVKDCPHIKNGYAVVTWIEEEVALNGFIPPIIQIHSANPSGRERMELGIKSIDRFHELNLQGK